MFYIINTSATNYDSLGDEILILETVLILDSRIQGKGLNWAEMICLYCSIPFFTDEQNYQFPAISGYQQLLVNTQLYPSGYWINHAYYTHYILLPIYNLWATFYPKIDP